MLSYGIREIGSYLPSTRIDCVELAKRLGVSDYTLGTKIGFDALAIKSESEDTSDMACKAVLDLMQRTGLLPDEISCMVVVTQNPDGFGIPQVSALVHGKLGWAESLATFDISLGCSGYVYALSIVSGFLAAQGGKHGILVTADPYSKIVDTDDRGTALLFGDAATATLISSDATWRIGASDFGTSGAMAGSLELDEGRKIRMRGKDIAKFCMREVPRSIERALEKNDLAMVDVDLVLLHQGSRFIVDGVGEMLGASEKTPFCAAAMGNTSSSSIPLALQDVLRAPIQPQALVLSSFGVGLSWASTVIRRNGQISVAGPQ